MHRELFSNDQFVLKALTSSSIPEHSVEASLDGKAVSSFQGLEVFEKISGHTSFPQTVADLISNSYVRLTYQKPEGSSATFGTSFICCHSLRTADHNFYLIPRSSKAEISTSTPNRLRVESVSYYHDFAQCRSTRTYGTEAVIGHTTMTYESRFTALRDIRISTSHARKDAFRLFSISSMYSSADCYDGNRISWKTENEECRTLRMQDIEERSNYLLEKNLVASEISLIKETGSKGRRGEPGSCDSPSVRIQLLECSIPFSELGIQGFLASSTDSNDDSLSVWLEWLAVPQIIKEGTEIFTRAKFCSFP